MNFSKRDKSIVDFLFMLALFGAFAITGLFVVLFGARVYQSTVAAMDANYSARTALSYVTEKIRAHDYCENGIDSAMEIIDNDGKAAIALKEKIGDRVFVTYLYEREGKLLEFTTDENYDFHFDAGTTILEIKSFDVKRVGDSLYRFNIEDIYDDATDFYVAVYSSAHNKREDYE